MRDLEDLAMEEKYWGIYNIEKDNIMTQNSLYDEGVEVGIEQGIEKRNVEIAKTMLKDGSDMSLIMKYTGLSKEEIEALQ